MPYLTKDNKDEVLDSPAAISQPGELNFLATQAVIDFLKNQGAMKGKYTSYNAAIGALECCKLEFYRRMVAPYEDLKIKENGDVYGQG